MISPADEFYKMFVLSKMSLLKFYIATVSATCHTDEAVSLLLNLSVYSMAFSNIKHATSSQYPSSIFSRVFYDLFERWNMDRETVPH